MIDLYTGTPGSGKSLHTASVILSVVYRQPVIVNFEIILKNEKMLSNYHYLENEELTPAYLIKFAKDYWFKKGTRVKEDHILLIIDECQLLFNCRDWGNKSRASWLSFFTQHRKLGYHIILIAQFDSMLDKQIRSLVEYQYIHRKVNNYGLAGKVIGFLCFGNLFCIVKVWYPMKERLSSSFFKAHKRIYKIYDTYNTFSQA